MNNEFDFITRNFLPLAKNTESMHLMNDAAYIKNKNLVISSDMMIENVHFKKNDSPYNIARKLLRVNLSDLSSMGSEPYGYILNLAIPKTKNDSWVSMFCEGLKIEQKQFNLKLFGGDISFSKSIFLSITIFGKNKMKPHNLNSAKENSDIFVSGYIGDAALGFFLENTNKIREYLDPEDLDYFKDSFWMPKPRINLGQNLNGFANSCTDISDGLLSDLNKIAFHSKLMAEIDITKIPLSNKSKKVKSLFSNTKKFWEIVLSGGEDYELIFSMNKQKQKVFFNDQRLNKNKITKIGSFKKGKGVFVYDNKNKRILYKKMGFCHF